MTDPREERGWGAGAGADGAAEDLAESGGCWLDGSVSHLHRSKDEREKCRQAPRSTCISDHGLKKPHP